jgi:hypothetical protein
MNFTPPPPNDFRDFFGTYFERCRALAPKIRVVAAKWTFEDLIPGLSDFDTRFIVEDDTTLADWHAMSLAVGRVHTELAMEVKSWARNLEHLPGLNLTAAEVAHPLLYYPEFSQWTFYDGDTGVIDTTETALAARTWSSRDEIYHLKKIAAFFGPYQRGIDPPINIGPWENKYPLHSRFMHYFTPPVQAMVSITQRQTIRGKLDALRLARRTLPNPQVIDLIFESLDAHYNMPALYAEPRLTELEAELEQYLRHAWGHIAGEVTLIEPSEDDTRQAIQEKVNAIPVDPIEAFFGYTKFARFMKGRLLFYADDIAWFDATWLIENELGRIVDNFCTRPLEAYAVVRLGEALDADTVLERLRGNPLDGEVVDGVKRFAAVAGAPLQAGREKEQARAAAEVYEPVLAMVEMLSADMLAVAEEMAARGNPHGVLPS